jgi:hypothetical protein
VAKLPFYRLSTLNLSQSKSVPGFSQKYSSEMIRQQSSDFPKGSASFHIINRISGGSFESNANSATFSIG